MKRLLIASLLLLAVSSPAVPQNRRARNRGRRPSAERRAPNRNMEGVNVRGNVVRFSRAWEIVKGSDGNTYARKKKITQVVLAVNCVCAQEGPRGTCFLQSIPGRNDALECNKGPDCIESCGVVTKWVEPKDFDTIGLP
ncbi:MAG TPA: hypothetical protein VN228_12645 [Pyrinomonadaceae bacterium]|nr:hypothetical protein [Pyrinomonadaceae bacterium]